MHNLADTQGMDDGIFGLYLKNPKIVYVDDDEDLRSIIPEFLIRDGAEVFVGSSGDEGLVLVNRHDPDLVITDLEMPKMTGDQLLIELRKTGFKKPVIFLTGKNNSESMQNAVKNEAFEYLFKPFQKEQLQKSVIRGLRAENSRLLFEAELKELYTLINQAMPKGQAPDPQAVKTRASQAVAASRTQKKSTLKAA